MGVPVSSDGKLLAVFESSTNSGPYALNVITTRTTVRELRTLVGPNAAGFTDGGPGVAQFNGPSGLAMSPDMSWIAVADSSNNAIRRVDLVSGVVSTIAGQVDSGSRDGPGITARFQYPTALAFSTDGATLFVSDTGAHLIRMIDTTSYVVSTLAGKLVGTFPLYQGGFVDAVGLNARFSSPQGLAVSPDGSTLFVSDVDNHAVRRISLATRSVTTLAGSGYPGNNDGPSPQFNQPRGLAAHPDGGLLAVADSGNLRVRLIDLTTGVGSTLAGSGQSVVQDGDA
eukprot:CAMPEP_0113692212 /NCGR_PEP_ID=MMETSP0038_2-20120614/18947_1 /TAXON_ID=2898 /ORGANISM="Cryptomonas paramecium" /LENGTH=283 /DNA_ID=CAMNT_0000614075 /DNA_START=227 /DNA_END=1074 /DNA_ORIENTATION=- /assembly_acc=CAM_ASM_000170